RVQSARALLRASLGAERRVHSVCFGSDAAAEPERRQAAAWTLTAGLAPTYVHAMARSRSPAAVLPSPWIVDRRYDALFLWAAWCVPFALVAVATALPYGLLLALTVFVLLDNSHQVASLPLTVFDPVTMRRAAPTYLGGAAAIGGTAIAVS